MAAVLSKSPKPKLATADLPAEFILHLGPQSVEQAAEVANKLRRLGAQVKIEGEGSLIAFRRK